MDSHRARGKAGRADNLDRLAAQHPAVIAVAGLPSEARPARRRGDRRRRRRVAAYLLLATLIIVGVAVALL